MLTGRPCVVDAQSFNENAQVGQDAKGKVVPSEAGQKKLYVALTSDRSLCGAVHSSIGKAKRNELLEKPNLDKIAIICVGDKFGYSAFGSQHQTRIKTE